MPSLTLKGNSLRRIGGAAFAGLLIAVVAMPANAGDWSTELRNITQEQGRTLLALSREARAITGSDTAIHIS